MICTVRVPWRAERFTPGRASRTGGYSGHQLAFPNQCAESSGLLPARASIGHDLGVVKKPQRRILATPLATDTAVVTGLGLQRLAVSEREKNLCRSTHRGRSVTYKVEVRATVIRPVRSLQRLGAARCMSVRASRPWPKRGFRPFNHTQRTTRGIALEQKTPPASKRKCGGRRSLDEPWFGAIVPAGKWTLSLALPAQRIII